MTNLRHNILTTIQMKKSNDGWITRKEIARALDIPGWEFTPRCKNAVRDLEQAGEIQSRMIGLWEYRAK